jgi:hypothetical protein
MKNPIANARDSAMPSDPSALVMVTQDAVPNAGLGLNSADEALDDTNKKQKTNTSRSADPAAAAEQPRLPR